MHLLQLRAKALFLVNAHDEHDRHTPKQWSDIVNTIGPVPQAEWHTEHAKNVIKNIANVRALSFLRIFD